MASHPNVRSGGRARIIRCARQVLVEGAISSWQTSPGERDVSVGCLTIASAQGGVMGAVVTEFYDGIRRAIDSGIHGPRLEGPRTQRLRRLVDYLYAIHSLP